MEMKGFPTRNRERTYSNDPKLFQGFLPEKR
jgi:hypothetical protein